MHGYMIMLGQRIYKSLMGTYLADVGFLMSQQLLIPYHGTQYHLKEWRPCWHQVWYAVLLVLFIYMTITGL